jgi:hypothetical protein
MMSGFFSDNHAKQKAYDRYYNAMARSNYVPGRKLKSLIERDAANDAQTGSLTNLFQKAMYKAREYDYDVITQKLMKKLPPL